MKPSIQIISICCDPVRKEFQQTMIRDLNLPYPILFFQGFTPKTSEDYITDRDKTYPESDTTICCMRSHAAAINMYVNDCTHSDIVLIIEDDVTFVTDFENKLNHVLELWDKHSNEIDFISIGYLLGSPKSLHTDDVLHWGQYVKGGSVWGTQGYLIKRPVAIEMAEILHQATTSQLRKSAYSKLTSVNNGWGYTTKHLLLQSDVMPSLLWRQAYVTPLLIIEYPTISLINNRNIYSDRYDSFFRNNTLYIKGFYKLSDIYTIADIAK